MSESHTGEKGRGLALSRYPLQHNEGLKYRKAGLNHTDGIHNIYEDFLQKGHFSKMAFVSFDVKVP